MQRRKFIQLSAVGGAAISITGISCGQRSPASYDLLAKPIELAQICDLKTLREIGTSFRLQAPSEREGDKLVTLLLTDTDGDRVPAASDDLAIRYLISRKIRQDFETGHTVIVKGWILAVTEARQCALLVVKNP